MKFFSSGTDRLGVGILSFGLPFLCVLSYPVAETSIGFGSCIDDKKPNHRLWNTLVQRDPDVFLFMGDNVYIDESTLRNDSTIEVFRSDYERLSKSKGFQRLIQSETNIFATWDDHDYGLNDSGAEFSLKALSQKQFLNFWYSVPFDIDLPQGVFQAHFLKFFGNRIQFILLDTRSFKSPWKRDSTWRHCRVGQVVPTEDESKTLLGKEQWRWLESRLEQEADLHILVSSIQVIPIDHCWERWGGMPHERDRLIRLISRASAQTILLSGDRHLAEASKLSTTEHEDLSIDLYEFTSSSMTSGVGFGANEENRYRMSENNVRVNNFGWLTIDWNEEQTQAKFVSSRGRSMQEFEIPLVPAELAHQGQ